MNSLVTSAWLICIVGGFVAPIWVAAHRVGTPRGWLLAAAVCALGAGLGFAVSDLDPLFPFFAFAAHGCLLAAGLAYGIKHGKPDNDTPD